MEFGEALPKTNATRFSSTRSRTLETDAHPEVERDPVTSEAELAWTLADAVSVCFTATDHLRIYSALGAGETYSAIEWTLYIAVRKRYPLPGRLIGVLTAWLDCYIGTAQEPTTRSLLDHAESRATPPLRRVR
jgi:hypothetical protein